MSVTPGISPVWTTGTTEGIRTGTWRSALPVHAGRPAPCQDACPLHGSIAEWIGLARSQQYHAAWTVLTGKNPFPAVIGRICHHPCESACNRGSYDEPLSVRRLERFLGDMALENDWRFPDVAIRHAQRVAVVGAGPSGLAVAYHLRRMGYAVTIYEARAEPGGVMRYGIPPYRLPRDILAREITRLLALGIGLNTDSPVTSPGAFEHLRREYDAVYVAVGAGRAKRHPLLDYDSKRVMQGSDYLAASGTGVAAHPAHVLVIGGGSAAMDVARTARRRGATVRVLCLEPAHLMPAQPEEIAEAREEGVTILDASMLESVQENGADMLALRCMKVEFAVGTGRGQYTITPVPGSEFPLAAELVISAIGQDPDLEAFAATLHLDSGMIGVRDNQETSHAGVFAGGDAASMNRFVSHALNMGRTAAAGIHAHFERARAASPDREPTVGPAEINTHYHPHRTRTGDPKLPPGTRVADFAEVQLSLDMDQALAESGRCFSCGHCTHCDNCYLYCPDMAVVRSDGGYAVLTDYCKGCGLCVRECPTGAVAMREDAR